jgi:TfoX/Sxy family transcriptional regulator of competence genes
MAYDEKLADRIRRTLASRKGVTEREMFGGIGFLLGGKFVAGVHRNELMVRVPAADHDALAREKGARTFEMAGRPPMKGWMLVDPKAVSSSPALKRWIDRSASAVAALPAKKPKKKAAPKKSAKASDARRARR